MTETKQEAPKVLSLDSMKISSSLVNSVKAERALRAANGNPKPQTAEAGLALKFKGELKGEELVLAIYKGLGGLVSEKKASVNRKNEKAAKRAKK